MGQFQVNEIIIPLYINSAKTFLELSTGALALSMIFREKILGDTGTRRLGILIVLSWVFYLLTIGASALYQYLAIKFLDRVSDFPGKTGYLESLVGAPGTVYGTMLIFFFVASVFLVASSVRQLLTKQR